MTVFVIEDAVGSKEAATRTSLGGRYFCLKRKPAPFAPKVP